MIEGGGLIGGGKLEDPIGEAMTADGVVESRLGCRAVALANEEVSADAKTLIRKALLPSLSGHLIELQQRRDRAA